MAQRPTFTAPTSEELFDLKLPSMPHTLVEILELRSQQSPDLDRLVATVQQDPVIAASVLRRVNSAYYGVRRPVSRVDQATMLLGFKEICGLVLMAAVKRAFAYRGLPEANAIHNHVMKTSVACASFARELSNYMTLADPETAFTAGLLYQMGRLAFLFSIPQGYARLWYEMSSSQNGAGLSSPSTMAEQFVFNTDYTKLGKIIGEKWKLPEDIVSVMEHHLEPSHVEKPYARHLTMIVAAAQSAAVQLFEPVEEEQETCHFLQALSTLRTINIQDLVEYLESKQIEVRLYAEAMLQD